MHFLALVQKYNQPRAKRDGKNGNRFVGSTQRFQTFVFRVEKRLYSIPILEWEMFALQRRFAAYTHRLNDILYSDGQEQDIMCGKSRIMDFENVHMCE